MYNISRNVMSHCCLAVIAVRPFGARTRFRTMLLRTRTKLSPNPSDDHRMAAFCTVGSPESRSTLEDAYTTSSGYVGATEPVKSTGSNGAFWALT